MSFLSTDTLKSKIQELNIISPFISERTKHSAYEMSLGGEAYLTSTSDKKKTLLSPGEELFIPPGQLALLLTEEVINMPDDLIGLISIRAGIKFSGLINVSGFHIDPGYSGKILFTVYNAGSTPAVIERGEPIFMLWLCKLDRAVTDGYSKKKQGRSSITSKDMSRLTGDIASPAALKLEIDQLKKEFEDTKRVALFLLGALATFMIGSALKCISTSTEAAPPAALIKIETTQQPSPPPPPPKTTQ